jgi:hypothetical protein
MMPRDEGELTMMNDNDSEPARLCHDEGEPGWSVMRTTLAKFKTTINLTDGSRLGRTQRAVVEASEEARSNGKVAGEERSVRRV